MSGHARCRHGKLGSEIVEDVSSLARPCRPCHRTIKSLSRTNRDHPDRRSPRAREKKIDSDSASTQGCALAGFLRKQKKKLKNKQSTYVINPSWQAPKASVIFQGNCPSRVEGTMDDLKKHVSAEITIQ